MKKIIFSIIGVVTLIGIVSAAVIILTKSQNSTNTESAGDSASDSSTNSNQSNQGGNMGKILVAYYSAQNHTKRVAEQIAQNLNADLFEIVPTEIYTADDLDWTADGSRVNREHEDESLRNIALVKATPDGWSEYDTVLIGYPIWWGIAAWPVNNFITENDFTNKTVIPFATSTSSGLGQSGKLLEDMANGGNWLAGQRFNSNPSENEIENWTDSLAK